MKPSAQVGQNLEELDLSCAAISAEAWNFLGSISVPRLKKLRMIIWNNLQEPYPEPLASLIENVSYLIEDLELNIHVELGHFFPNLRRICMFRWGNGLSPFTVDRFPVLQEVALTIPKTFWTFLETEFTPHGGVEVLRIFVQGTMSAEENALDTKMPLLLACLSRKFPNVTNFNLSCLQHYSRFCNNIFRDICSFFPHLKRLRYNGSVDFSMVSGTHMDVINDCLAADWSIKDIPRRSGSIVDLIELETLHFGSDAHITDDMIKYCLSQMPALQVLEFHWNPHVSAQVVQDYLGHLKEIKMF